MRPWYFNNYTKIFFLYFLAIVSYPFSSDTDISGYIHASKPKRCSPDVQRIFPNTLYIYIYTHTYTQMCVV